jgi:arginine-tRNA-protein transferase
MPYVYLGYWIEKSAKMAYKINFKPIEALRNGNWVQMEE